ncbi:uncharacterized protein BDW70DRAFT_168670 [Aspergillus foveolatus]|uniref:uncharacterized protein n=1 Tax=Aspergillus foveolatus TaxID=210207 RepID=UPI003CCD0BB3
MESLLAPESVQGSDGSWALQDGLNAQRQLDALLRFVKDQTRLRATDWTFRKPDRTANGVASSESDIAQLSLSDTTRSDSPPSPKASRNEAAHNLASRSQRPTPSDANSQCRKCPGTTDNFVSVPRSLSVGNETLSLYSQACSLLLQGLDSDGVLLLDAPRDQSRNSSRRPSCIDPTEMGSIAEFASFHRRSPSLSSQGEWLDKEAELLGSAFAGSHNTKSHGELPYKLDLGLLRNLFALFPDGEIFNSNHSTAPATAADDFVPDDLKKAFPDAASVIFLPLWDTVKSRWIAGLVIWTSRYHFKQQDLEYVRLFSGTIVSELARIDQASTNKSKDHLLSSVSHELRSPLHGMLANSELLQSTNLDRTQHEMVEMIKTCGNTLLETMNHLLDFAKINNLTNSNSGSGSDAGHIDTLTSSFDVDKLIEDVTEVLYAGHRSRINAPEAGGLYFSTGTKRPSQPVSNNVLSVIVRTEGNHSWKIHSIPGAWRRIIMDLVGNALKFTRSGLIEVSLSQTGDNSSRATHAEIKVTDTGCGISREYLQNHIFSPFSQEQVLTEGVGLGLCIAHKLVTYLGGHIDISSELGVGTQACIRIPIRFADEEQVVGNFGPNDDGTCCAKKVCLVDLNPVLPEDQRLSFPEAKRKLAVRDALRSALSNRHGWELLFADDLNDASGDIAVLEQSKLEKLAIPGPLKTTFRSVVVLRNHNVSAFEDLELDGVVNIAYISQPLGPRKITQALKQIAEPDGLNLRSLRNDQSREHSMSIPAAPSLDSPPAVRNSVSYFSAAEAGPLQGGLHVLIVDDNDINLKVLSTFMSKIGCSYDTASNGLVAVEKYRQTQQKFDYVLMDISMPIMDGITASRTIREYEDESLLEPCTIMAVTGVASSDMQQQAFAAGMDDYLVKPLSLHDLKRILGVN